MKPNNPFLIAGYLNPAYFCDRTDETRILQESLQNGRNITLIAPRRMGKTGLIKNVFYQLQESNKDAKCFYLDIYSTQNLSDFIHLFAAKTLGKLDKTPKKIIQRVTTFMKSCRPTFTYDTVSGVPKVSIEIAPTKEEATLSEIFEYLASAEKPCYIAMDEFQQLAEYPEKGVEALLRSFIQFAPNLHFIFSGSRQHIMQEMFLSAKRPFFQSTQLLTIEAIERNNYYQFAKSFFAAKKCDLKEDIFNTIYDKFEGHTWYIQYLLNRLYEYKKTPDEALVQRAISEILAENEYSYQSLLSTLTTNSVKLLKAVAKEEKVTAINAHDFIAKYNLTSVSSINRSLERLLEYEMIYHNQNGYIVYDRFMSLWLKELPF